MLRLQPQPLHPDQRIAILRKIASLLLRRASRLQQAHQSLVVAVYTHGWRGLSYRSPLSELRGGGSTVLQHQVCGVLPISCKELSHRVEDKKQMPRDLRSMHQWQVPTGKRLRRSEGYCQVSAQAEER